MVRNSLWPGACRLRPKRPLAVPNCRSRSLASQNSPFRSQSQQKRAPQAAFRPRPPSFPIWGRDQLKRLRSSGIGTHMSLERLKLSQGLKNFGIRIAPSHCLRLIDEQWFTDSGHPKGLMIAERCIDHDKTKPLWRATLVSGGLSIVRGKAKARINTALSQALCNMGYDRDGRKVDPTKPQYPERVGDSRNAWRKSIVELRGTAQIHSNDALDVLNRPFTELRRLLEGAVRSFEEVMGRNAAGQSAHGAIKGTASARPQPQSFTRNPADARRDRNTGSGSRNRPVKHW